ncbi:MAG: alpha/beta fold hydrolase [Simkaniaceae bacterium]|nr:MAG: alpha/beta fold hydrolase [Simkaniaceae bacterium]
MVSKVLFDAHRRTVLEEDSLLEGLRPMKEGLIEALDGIEINFRAINGDTVNGIHFKGTEPKAIIFLHGNGCFYETSGCKPLSWRESLTREGTTLPHLIIFNPRGTGESTGRTQTNYVIEDFILMFDHLVNVCHVDPSHVVIGGHSMGGYFSLFGAAAIQKRYPEAKINFISDRSIWDLKSRVAAKVEGAGYLGWKAFLLSSYISSVISSPDWSRDSIEALESLKGRVFVIYHPKDGVVLYDDSTHKGLLDARRINEYFCLELSEDDPHAEVGPRPHNREFSDRENQKIVAELRRMLEIPPSSEDEPLHVLKP